ncbi:MAG: ethanolamine ammonia-lyase subunit EutB, partial [Terriglobales bacterium]
MAYRFSGLREILAKANEQKSGDELAGIAAGSEQERVAAKCALADIPLADIAATPLIEDDVTALLYQRYDQEGFRNIRSLTVGEFREFILEQPHEILKPLQPAILPEIAAAVAKLMSNRDLVTASAKFRNVTRCRNTMGGPGVLGIRLQPNHPSDDVGGILL